MLTFLGYNYRYIQRWKLRNNKNKLFKDSIQESNKECRCNSRDTGRKEMLKIRIEISELSNQNDKRKKLKASFEEIPGMSNQGEKKEKKKVQKQLI